MSLPPATKDFTMYIGSLFGPYILYFNQTRSHTLGEVTVDIATDTFTLAAHGLINGDQVRFTATAISPETDYETPGPLDEGVYYFVINSATNTFKLSLTSGGSAINIVDDGIGTIKVIKRGIPLDITGYNIRAWARSADFFLDLNPTIILATDGSVQLLVDDSVTQVQKRGDHEWSVMLQNVASDWTGPFLIGKFLIRKVAVDSGTPPT